MAVETRAPAIIVGNLIPFIVACFFYFGRFYSRTVILRIFPLEDWILAASFIAAIANCALAILATNYGAGKHQMDIPMADIVPFFKVNWVDRIMYQTCLTLTKLSLCTMYLRIFGVQRKDKYFLWAINILLITHTVALDLFNIFQCNPISHSWDIFGKGACADDVPGFWASFSISLFVDVALLVFSALKVKDLQMPRAQKAAISFMVGLGWMTVVAAIVRAVKISAVIKDSSDASWRTYDTSIWSSVELNVAIICTCAPAVKPLLKQLAPGLMYSLSKGYNTSAQQKYGNNTQGKSKTHLTANGTIQGGGDDTGILLDEVKQHNQIMKASEVIVIREDGSGRSV